MNYDQLFKGVTSRRDTPLILDRLEAKRVCEVGVRKGEFFEILVRGRKLKLAVAIDIWEGYLQDSQNDENHSRFDLGIMRRIFELKFKPLPGVVIVNELSQIAVEAFPDELFDFVYLDADHTRKETTKDLMRWWDKVRTGGVIAGHDYNSINANAGEKFEVKKAVDYFVGYYDLQDQLFVTNESVQSFYILKP